MTEKTILQRIKDAVFCGNNKADLAREEKVRNIERLRLSVAKAYKKHVDKLIEDLPHRVEQAIANAKYTPYGLVRVENVSIREMYDHDWGLAKPRPGTYVEYLFNRLTELGFSPQCEYNDFLGFWYGMMCLDVKKYEKEFDRNQ